MFEINILFQDESEKIKHKEIILNFKINFCYKFKVSFVHSYLPDVSELLLVSTSRTSTCIIKYQVLLYCTLILYCNTTR